MFSYALAKRIRLFLPSYKFYNLLGKQILEELEDNLFDEILKETPNSKNSQKWLKKLKDPIERLIVIALTAIKLAEKKKVKDLDLVFILSRIPKFYFPEFTKENIKIYSQTDLDEVNTFMEEFLNYLPIYSPRNDTKLTLLLKIEFYINTFLYFALSMNEKRFPYGNQYHQYLAFMIHEFYSILKPSPDTYTTGFDSNKYPTERVSLCNALYPLMSFNSVIYLLDHFPEQAAHVFFILQNVSDLAFSSQEKEIFSEYLLKIIYITNKDKTEILKKLEETKT